MAKERFKRFCGSIALIALMSFLVLVPLNDASASGLHQTENTIEYDTITSDDGGSLITQVSAIDKGGGSLGGMETDFAMVSPEQFNTPGIAHPKGGGSLKTSIKTVL